MKTYLEFLNEKKEGPWMNEYIGDMNISGEKWIVDGKLKIPKIGVLKGNFTCTDMGLTTLEGCPKVVEGNFDVYSNKLVDLKGSPGKITGTFAAHHNLLTSLEGGPLRVGINYVAADNKLTNLKGAPKEIHDYFNVDNNELKTLEGGPIIARGTYSAQHNPLENIEHGPRLMESDLHVDWNERKNLYYERIFLMDRCRDITNKKYKGCMDLDYWPELIEFMIKKYPKKLEEINWPDHMMKDPKFGNIIRSAKGLGKYKI